jgi:hypothetical protein
MLSKVFSVFVSGIAHDRSVLPNKMPGPTTLLVSEGFFDFGTVFSQLDINKFANFVILEIFFPQLVPSGLTTGTSSTCRRTSSEGMSLSVIAILLASH